MDYIIMLFMLAILVSLGSALFYLFRKKNSDPKQMVKALTARISLSLALFIFLLVAFALGWITPHGI